VQRIEGGVVDPIKFIHSLSGRRADSMTSLHSGRKTNR